MNTLCKRFIPTPLYLLNVDERGNRLFIKREDLFPYSFGGNKARIGMEYLKDMQKKACNHLVAYGNARSNLCRVLGNLCAELKFPFTVLSPADEDGCRRIAFNEELCQLFGAKIIPCLKTNVPKSVEAILQSICHAGEKPYYIYGNQLGKGNEATPVKAYVPIYAEITEQAQEIQASFDAIFLASGTGMTQAGLLCGKAIADEEMQHCRVIGLSIAREEMQLHSNIFAYADAYFTETQVGNKYKLLPEAVEVFDDFRESYGRCNHAVAQCIRQTMASYGVPLDETYTGKAFHGMLQLIQRWNWKDRDILFIHTGGTPLFFDALRQWESPDK